MPTRDDQPWEQQPGESPPAYNAFCIYRDMPAGDRSCSAAWRLRSGRRTVAPGFFRKWYRVWRWAERAQALDAERSRLALVEEARALGKRAVRRRDQAAGFREALAAPMLELVRRIEKRELDYAEVKAGDLMQLVLLSARVFPRVALVERLEEGKPTELVAAEGWTGPVPDVRTDEEHLAAVFAALEEAGMLPAPIEAAEVRELPPPREAAG